MSAADEQQSVTVSVRLLRFYPAEEKWSSYETPALHVMFFTSFFPAQLLRSKQKHLSGAGGNV